MMKHVGRNYLDDGILGTCTRLEKLSLSCCGPELRGVWRLQHARLKDIRIFLCFVASINLVWLPRLEHFTLDCWFSTRDGLVSLGYVPRLTTFNLSGDIACTEQNLKLSRILANNTALADLRLDFNGNNVSTYYNNNSM